MDHQRVNLTWKSKLWKVAIPTCSALLSFLFVVIPALSKLAGRYSFLVFTCVVLFFFPERGIVNQIEVNVLSFVGGVLGIGLSCGILAVASYCGSHYGADSPEARGILAAGFVVLAFIGGFARSYSARLYVASRIFLFFSSFLLTAYQDTVKMESHYFTDMFAVVCAAFAFSLLPVLLFSYHSSSLSLGHSVSDIIEVISGLLPMSLSTVLDHGEPPSLDRLAMSADEHGAGSARRNHDEMARRLGEISNSLRPTYEGYLREFSRTKAPRHFLEPVISALGRLHRNPLLGSSSHVPGERIQAAIRKANDFAGSGPSPSVSRPLSAPGTPRIARHSRSFIRPPDAGSESVNLDPISGAGRPPLSSHGRLTHLGGSVTHRRSGSALAVSERLRLDSVSKNLVDSITASLRSAIDILFQSYNWGKVARPREETDLISAKHDLELALTDLQCHLAGVLDGLPDIRFNETFRSAREPTGAHDTDDTGLQDSSTVRRLAIDSTWTDTTHIRDRDLIRTAFYMASLLDLAKDVLSLVLTVQGILAKSDKVNRWRWPHVRLMWPVLTSSQGNIDRDDIELEEAENKQDAEKDDRSLAPMDFVNLTLQREKPHRKVVQTWLDRLEASWRVVWDQSRVVRGRVVLSHFLHFLRHSSHVLFGLKMSFGVGLLALPAFLPPDSAGRAWFAKYHGVWTVISYIMVLEVHTGATLMTGVYRLAGTFIGALAAYIVCVKVVLICHNNPYALVVLGTACSIPLSYGILFTSIPPLPIVTSITLPPLLFFGFLGLNEGQSTFTLVWTRFVDITIGIVSAILIGSLIWPNHARVRYFMSISSTLDRITEYYLRMSRDNLRLSLVYQVNPKQYARLEADAREHLRLSQLLLDIQKKEVSLLPRPFKLYSEVVDCVQRLLGTLCEVRVLRFSVPRKATVLDVLPLRRECASSILVNLWAISQSFRSRTPLPQFLPSPRVAVEGVMEAVDEHARKVRRRAKVSQSDIGGGEPADGQGIQDELAVLYGMAENEALGDLCDVLDELIAAAHTLFGTKTFVEASDQNFCEPS